MIHDPTESASHSPGSLDTLSTPRKILYLDHTAEWSGGEIALYALLTKLDRRRFTPIVVLSAEGPLLDRLREAGIETHYLPLSAQVTKIRKESLKGGVLARTGILFQLLRYTLYLARFMRKHRVELVHTNSLKSDIYGGFAGRLARIPVVWHVRDRIENDYLPSPAVRLFRLGSRLVPVCVVANSQATLATLHLPAKKPQDVVYSGVTLEDLKMKENDAPPLHSGPRIGIVGRLTAWKGQHIFLQAAAKVRAQVPNAKFPIIGKALFGEEAYEQELRSLVSSLSLDEAVEFLGFRKDVPDLLTNLDILVHASTTGEPFGQVVVQGMAAGLPVVATNGGGIPEIVLSGKTGLLVPMGDADAMAEAILRLLADPQGAKAMGRAGRLRVEQLFTIEEAARKVESLYETLLPPRRA